MSQKTLIVGDLQYDFVSTGGALYIGDQVKPMIDNIVRLLKDTEFENVILIQDWHVADDPEFDIWGAHCIQNTHGAEIVSDIAEYGDYRIKKRRYSAFFGTDLDLYLRERDAQDILVTGVMANVCVLHTTGDARARGYNVTVIDDCIEAPSHYEKQYALYHISHIFGARIVSLDQI